MTAQSQTLTQDQQQFEAWARKELGMPDEVQFNWHADWVKTSFHAWCAGAKSNGDSAAATQRPDTRTLGPDALKLIAKISEFSHEDFVYIFYHRPDLADRMRQALGLGDAHLSSRANTPRP